MRYIFGSFSCICLIASFPLHAGALNIVVKSADTGISNHQTVPLKLESISSKLRFAVMNAGLSSSEADAGAVLVTVIGYSSGAKFGASKTATIMISTLYSGEKLPDVGCRKTVAFDLRSTEKRNIQAVDECLSALSASFTQLLSDRLAKSLPHAGR